MWLIQRDIRADHIVHGIYIYVNVDHVVRNIPPIVKNPREFECESRVGVLDDDEMPWKYHLEPARKDADLLLRVVLRTNDRSQLAACVDASHCYLAPIIPARVQL